MKNIVFLLLIGLFSATSLRAQTPTHALPQDVKTAFLNFKKKQIAQWDKDYKGQNMVIIPKEYLEKMTQLVDKQALTSAEIDTLMRLATALQDGADRGLYAFWEGGKPRALEWIMGLPNPTMPVQEKPAVDITAVNPKIETMVADKKNWTKWYIIAFLLLIGLYIFSKNKAMGLYSMLKRHDLNNKEKDPKHPFSFSEFFSTLFNVLKGKEHTPSVLPPNLAENKGTANTIETFSNEIKKNEEKAAETRLIDEKLKEEQAKIALEEQKLADEKAKMALEKQQFEKEKQAIEQERKVKIEAEKADKKRKAAEEQAALRAKHQKSIEPKKVAQVVENQAYSGRVFYLAGPNSDGSFVNYNGSDSFIPYTSMYRFTLHEQDETKAQFEFWNDTTSTPDALADQIGYLDPVSVGLNPHDANAKRIKTEKKGVAKLVGDRWILEKKAEIFYDI